MKLDREAKARMDALLEGRAAFQRGADEGNNPYPQGGDLHGRWLSGWRSEQARAIEHTDIRGTK
jgi:hypothetical protein